MKKTEFRIVIILLLTAASGFRMRSWTVYHWGVYSVLGDGEKVMNVKQIPINTYEKTSFVF